MAMEFDETLSPEEREKLFRQAIESTRKELYEEAIKRGATVEEATRESTRFCL